MTVQRLRWERARFQRLRVAVAHAPTPETRRAMFESLLECQKLERQLARDEILGSMLVFRVCDSCGLLFMGERCECPGMYRYEVSLDYGEWWRVE